MIYKKNLYIFYINQWTKSKFWLIVKLLGFPILFKNGK